MEFRDLFIGTICLLSALTVPSVALADDDDDDEDGGGGSPVAEILVQCDRGDSINEALGLAPGYARWTVIVQGVCTEVVFIAADNVTVKGDPEIGGRVEGRFTVDGARRVRIEDLTISGSDRGIRVNFGAYVRITNVTIENMSRTGIFAFNGGIASVEGSTILGPTEDGIVAVEGAVLDIRDSIIDGADFGISVSNGATLNLETSIIKGATLDGLQMSSGSSARLVDNEITDVARNPINIVQNAFVRIRNSTLIASNPREEAILLDGGSIRLEGGNTVTGLNGGLSIRARNGSIVRQFIGLGDGPDVLNGEVRTRRLSYAGFGDARINGGVRVEWKSFVDLSGNEADDVVIIGDVLVSEDSQILLSSFGPRISGNLLCFDDESSLSDDSEMASVSGTIDCTGFD